MDASPLCSIRGPPRNSESLVNYASLDRRNFKGQTALFVAVVRSSVEIIETLLHNGATHQSDHKGVLPMELLSPDQLEVKKLLLEYGSPVTPSSDNPELLYMSS